MKKIFRAKRLLMAIALGTLLVIGMNGYTSAASTQNAALHDDKFTPASMNGEKLQMTEEWEKVFPKSEKVNHHKVSFYNRYGIALAADVYEPKDVKNGEKLPAIVVGGPFGAVKEQASGLYAQTLAEQGYLTVAFDPSFTGESGGNTRNVASPDIATEDYSAAIDFLATQDNVDKARIGIVGICGYGSIALNNASMDTRVKATLVSTMYDMTRFYANGYNDANDQAETRHAALVGLNQQRTEDYKEGKYARTGANLTPEQLTADSPQFIKDYTMYYETKRGFHPRSVNSVGGWNKTSALSFINLPFLQRSNEIQSAVLMIHGEKAHSRYFSEDAFRKLKGDNKELYIVPGASHTDLYDQMNVIPWHKISDFFQKNLK